MTKDANPTKDPGTAAASHTNGAAETLIDASAPGTLLQYNLTTDPFPLQASTQSGPSVEATLTVVASNANPSSPVTLRGLAIKLPVGPDASDLTADATAVFPIAPAGWTLTDTKQGAGTVEYVFQPQAGHGSVGRQGLAFIFSNLLINTQPGTCQIKVTEGSAGNPSAYLYTTKFPSGWGAVSFYAIPPDVSYDGTATLSWDGPTGATYTIEYALGGEVVNYPAPGQPALGHEGRYQTPALTRTTVFTLNVTDYVGGQQYAAQLQQAVTVAAPEPTVKLFRGTLTTTSAGWSLNFEWEAEHADYCMLSGVPVELTPASPAGGYTLSAQGVAAAYTLTAVNGAGSASSTLDVVWVEAVYKPLGTFTLQGVAVSPDGAHLYASVEVLDSLATYTVTTGPHPTIGFDSGMPPFIGPLRAKVMGNALSSDGSTLYVAYEEDGAVQAQVVAYDVNDKRPINSSRTNVGQHPLGVALSPDDKLLYLTCNPGGASGTLSVFQLPANVASPLQATGTPVNVPDAPLGGAAVSPDGSRLFVGAGNTVKVFDLAQDSGEPTPAGSNPVAETGCQVRDVAFVPGEGDIVYALVADAAGNGSLIALNSQTLQPAAPPVAVRPHPHFMVFAPDRTNLYITSGGSTEHEILSLVAVLIPSLRGGAEP